LKRRGAEGIVFGCTEIGLMLTGADCPLPILDTTAIHAAAAVDFALS
jgi:aspartate/glutamate racemase